jgi:hypothetical protein
MKRCRHRGRKREEVAQAPTQHQVRGSGVTPLGKPAIVGEDSRAKIGKMSRNLRRAMERERDKQR